ncbi:MAG: hydrogenase maturation nickel metallochaperone HypA [Bacteroidales bacterium]|nr:hydrogenase maturation nickel metallochaperone HypA [Bacteroidales bacterium]MBN2632658.1 hydrogenase maturation nickel metallochaperone HypA [Bacteroidales bacterium]
MHELRIVEDLMTIVRKVAEEKGLKKVTKVNISMGKLVQIVPSLLEAAFNEAVAGSVAEGASIEIETVAVQLRCRICGKTFTPDANGFECPVCRISDIDVLNGNELFIKSIEGE